MNCKNLKKRQRKYKTFIYCNKLKKEICFDNCRNCEYKEYKEYKPIKKRTYKQSKIEKERFSIIYTNFNKCCECGLNNASYDKRINQYTHIDKNEVFEGAYRNKSIELGMVAPLCTHCHKLFHSDILFNLKYKLMFQREYLKNHTIDEFVNNFGQDYREKAKKLDRR